jgi:glyoxylase I family protein
MRIHHIALRTRDLARLRAFYIDRLGFALAKGGETDRVWLDAGGTLLMLERATESEPGIACGTMELIAFGIAPSERAWLEARLASSGVEIEARTAFTLYFRDPDGRRLALSHHPEPAPGATPLDG